MNSFLIFLSFSLISIIATDDRSYSVLIGWIGDGKTFFCNKYDGSVCPSSKKSSENRERADTVNSYIGNHFIDGPGFGENRLNEENLQHQSSLTAIKTTLRTIDKKNIRSIIWMVPCTEQRTKGEAYDLVRIYIDMIGPAIPVIAVFNPGDAQNHCVKRPEDFIAYAKEYSINIREVIHIDHFDLSDFENRYAISYRVILPDNLEEILNSRDPIYLANVLKKNRELQCEKLPNHLQELRRQIDEKRQMILPESSIAHCILGTCENIPEPEFKTCTVTYCSSYDSSCRGMLFWRRCRNYCAQYNTYQDEKCVNDNTILKQNYENSVSECTLRINQMYEQCVKSREATVKKLNLDNAEFESSIQRLKEEEIDTASKLSACKVLPDLVLDKKNSDERKDL